MQIFFDNLTNSTLAIGYYNVITKQGKFLETPVNGRESLGQTDFTVSDCGRTLNIDFIEVDNVETETLIVYCAKLSKRT